MEKTLKSGVGMARGGKGRKPGGALTRESGGFSGTCGMVAGGPPLLGDMEMSIVRVRLGDGKRRI